MGVYVCVCLCMAVYEGIWRYMAVYRCVWSETMFLVNPTMDMDSVSWHWPSWGEDASVTAWSETMSLALFIDIPIIR